jgi:hypothetical protein
MDLGQLRLSSGWVAGERTRRSVWPPDVAPPVSPAGPFCGRHPSFEGPAVGGQLTSLKTAELGVPSGPAAARLPRSWPSWRRQGDRQKFRRNSARFDATNVTSLSSDLPADLRDLTFVRSDGLVAETAAVSVRNKRMSTLRLPML